MLELIPLLMFLAVFAALMAGYPVAFTLAGVGLLFAFGGHLLGIYNLSSMGFLPGPDLRHRHQRNPGGGAPVRVHGCDAGALGWRRTCWRPWDALFGSLRGGLGMAVILVGMLLAASTGIVGATVVTMGLLALPTMLRHGYDPKLATGAIAPRAPWARSFRPPSCWCCWAMCCLGLPARAAGAGMFAPRPCRWATCLPVR
jgi:TRAP-type mannitol/chloroaromatic compound transport system permease large subunit